MFKRFIVFGVTYLLLVLYTVLLVHILSDFLQLSSQRSTVFKIIAISTTTIGLIVGAVISYAKRRKRG